MNRLTNTEKNIFFKFNIVEIFIQNLKYGFNLKKEISFDMYSVVK